jgi:hypothetical protein
MAGRRRHGHVNGLGQHGANVAFGGQELQSVETVEPTACSFKTFKEIQLAK